MLWVFAYILEFFSGWSQITIKVEAPFEKKKKKNVDESSQNVIVNKGQPKSCLPSGNNTFLASILVQKYM